MVVPRSSTELAKDDEFTLFAVTVFKKFSPEFVHKCREKRWIPREWKFTEGGAEAEAKELDKLEKEERRVWGEALRLSRTGYSDAVMAWIHVLALRVFVETVLRYGLPLSFACGLVKVYSTPLSIVELLITNATPHRRIRRRARRPRPTLMLLTRILEEMLSARTRRVESQRMTLPCRPRFSPSEAPMPKTTTHTSSTSLRSHNWSSQMMLSSLLFLSIEDSIPSESIGRSFNCLPPLRIFFFLVHICIIFVLCMQVYHSFLDHKQA